MPTFWVTPHLNALVLWSFVLVSTFRRVTSCVRVDVNVWMNLPSNRSVKTVLSTVFHLGGMTRKVSSSYSCHTGNVLSVSLRMCTQL